MTRHLFLEADSGSGKSTLLRELIAPHIDEVGGFSSQRLLDDNNETIAFRIVPANDLRLAIPYEDTPETIFRTISNDHRGQSYPEVFGTEGMRLLESVSEKKLILLDEIGGLELKNQAFKNKLLEILSGDTPCIGVIKQSKKAASMDAGSIAGQNALLRKMMLEEFGCKIIGFKRNDLAVADEVRSFISQIQF